MSIPVRDIFGGNLDINLIPKSGLGWEVGICPWNES